MLQSPVLDVQGHVGVLCAASLSRVQLLVTPWTVACQAFLSVELFRQEFCNGLPFPPPGDLPHPGIEPGSPASPAWAGEYLGIPGKHCVSCTGS